MRQLTITYRQVAFSIAHTEKDLKKRIKRNNKTIYKSNSRSFKHVILDIDGFKLILAQYLRLILWIIATNSSNIQYHVIPKI